MWKYISPELAQDLKDFIYEDNMSPKDFGSLLEIGVGHIYNILNDCKPMTATLRSKIQTITKFDYQYLIENTCVSESMHQLHLTKTK